MTRIITSALFTAILFLTACKEITSEKINSPRDIIAENIDTTVNPGDNFFRFANGKWIKNNPIPASESGWTIGHLIQDETYNNLRKISENAGTTTAEAGSDTRKIGDFWKTGMDSAKANELGIQPLKAELDRIAAITDVKGVVATAIAFEPLQTGMFWNYYISQDAKNSNLMSIGLDQGGLSLGEREYYLNMDSSNKSIREKFVAHLGRTLQLIGIPADASAQAAQDVLAFETKLAKSSRKLEDLRDPVRNYNKMAIGNVTAKLCPSINWLEAVTGYGLKYVDSAVVGQPEFYSGLENALQTTPVEVLKNYMRYQLVITYANYLSKTMIDERFSFYGKELSGAKTLRPRWKRVLDAEEQAMGMVLGKLFVKEFFSEKSKKRYSDMVEAIRDVYADRIQALSWMSDETKQKALQKLSSMKKKVGYPDVWKDYSKLVVGTNSYCENMMNAARWRFNDMTSKYGKPVDRSEWEMTPQTYNAYYNALNNEIVLPAAIFAVPGIPDSLIDDAVVYGYAGASTIGHEITHGFDDEGRQFDANGNLQQWWTAGDEKQFIERADLMVKQFDMYEPLPGKHINGKATLGENIADYGGILLGLGAFRRTEQYKKGEKISGYTPIQRYFLGYALGWLGHTTEKSLANRLMTDVHSPAEWRVNGPFANIEDFYAAFGIQQGQPMWRPQTDRPQIW
jgi:putative endopeptidase